MRKIASVFLAASVLAALIAAPSAAAAGEGETLFKQKCAACHGPDGGKTPGASRALNSADVRKMSADQLSDFIARGKPPKMPSYEKSLGRDKILDIAAYLKTLKAK